MTEPTMSPSTAGAAQVEVVRSEEQLQVSTRPVVSGRLRLVKRVVSEERVVTVTVRREELVVERLPATDADTHPSADAPALHAPGSRDGTVLELVLSEEHVEVVTRVVPRERVRVVVDTETEMVQVTENLAREVVEVDGVDSPVPAR